MRNALVSRYISNKAFTKELIYGITGRELSDNATIIPEHTIDLLNHPNYSRFDASVDDCDVEWEADKLKLLKRYKTTTKTKFTVDTYKGSRLKMPYEQFMSAHRHVYYSTDVQEVYYRIFHGKGIRKLHYTTAFGSLHANDAIEPDYFVLFVNNANPLAQNLIDINKVCDTLAWYDLNVFMIGNLPKNINPVTEVLVYFFNVAHVEKLFLSMSRHITNPRAKDLVTIIVDMMRKIKGDVDLLNTLISEDIAHSMTKEMRDIPAVAVSLGQLLYESRVEGEAKGEVKGEVKGIIKTALAMIALKVKKEFISVATSLSLPFVEKLETIQTPEEGYDLYLMSLFDEARESFKNGDSLDKVCQQSKLSKSALDLIQKTDFAVPLSDIFEDLKSIAWEAAEAV
jgi:hypothetical protein